MRTARIPALVLALMLLAAPAAADLAPASGGGTKQTAGPSTGKGFAAETAAREATARRAPDLTVEQRLAHLEEGLEMHRTLRDLGLQKRRDLHFLSGVEAAHELASLEDANGETLVVRWRHSSGSARPRRFRSRGVKRKASLGGHRCQGRDRLRPLFTETES